MLAGVIPHKQTEPLEESWRLDHTLSGLPVAMANCHQSLGAQTVPLSGERYSRIALEIALW